MLDVDQVVTTLPTSFCNKYQTTCAIIDVTEIFLETPRDLHLQSSTWSSYKSHNTGKIPVGCTPNGAITYVSPMYVGSISDVELTHVCGFLDKLEGKHGILVMADTGLTIKDMVSDIGIELNIPSFLEARPDFLKKTSGKHATLHHFAYMSSVPLVESKSLPYCKEISLYQCHVWQTR